MTKKALERKYVKKILAEHGFELDEMIKERKGFSEKLEKAKRRTLPVDDLPELTRRIRIHE